MNELYTKEAKQVVAGLLSSLDAIGTMQLPVGCHDELNTSFQKIRDVITDGISSIKLDLERVSESSEWDKLNVAFFGETNAGKSTLLEALTGGDGRSIGDGRKDFTRKVNCTTHLGVNLMDMPGIEGRESRIINNIHKAVNKAHVIFYVNGTDKVPEERTVGKIKSFLNNRVKVYSIMNVRGRPSVYRYKKELVDDNQRTTEGLVRKRFSSLLGANYAGNIIVQGHLAFLTGSRIKKKRFLDDQGKAIEVFNDLAGIKNFSNIDSVNGVIEQLRQDLPNEIIISNTNKLLSGISSVLVRILREKKEFDLSIAEVEKLSNGYLADARGIIAKYEGEIRNIYDTGVNGLKVALKQTVASAIDNGTSESKLKSEIGKVEKGHSKKMKVQVNELLVAMKGELKSRIKELKGRLSLQMSIRDLSGDFDIESILKRLEIGVSYVMKQFLDIGMSLIGVAAAFALNIFAGIGAVIVLVARKLWEWITGDRNQRKRNAKNTANREIDEAITREKGKLLNELDSSLGKLNREVELPLEHLGVTIRGVKQISRALDEKIAEIKKAQVGLSHLLVKRVIGDAIEFAYVDRQLQEAVVVGITSGEDKEALIAQLLRLERIELYESHDAWHEKAGSWTSSRETYIAKDELNYRAVSAYFTHVNRRGRVKNAARRNAA